MNVSFQGWLQAVWVSVMEPSESARKLLAMNLSREVLWTAIALIAVLNVILLATLQIVSPAPVALQDQAFSLSPFAYVAIVGVFLVFFAVSIFQIGKFFGGNGMFEGSLAVIVWFQSISLTMEAVQLVLVLISPAIASLFGLLALGALVWCFVNFVNILHGYDSLGKSFIAIVLALIVAALLSGIILTVFGVTPSGALA